MKKSSKVKLPAYSLTEILVVLCIIGILIYIAVPDQTATISRAKSIEAQNMLNMVYSLEKNHFYRTGKYSNDLGEIGFEPEKTIDEGGIAVYKIEVVQSSATSLKAQAVSIQDLDGDGAYNTWEINEAREMMETIRD